MNFKKILAALVPLIILCGCGKAEVLNGSRWYIDDVNETVRTVVTFSEDSGDLDINYVLIDKERAKRTGVDKLQYFFDKYYYRDYGKKIPKQYNDIAEDECAFAVYYTKEDYLSDENSVITFYHTEDGDLVVNGNVCRPLTGKFAEEIDKIIVKNKADIGE